MSMNATVPFEDGVNVDSIIRRLKNVKRERRKIEKDEPKEQPEKRPSPTPGKEGDDGLTTEMPKNRTSHQASGFTTPNIDELVDENGNIRPTATIVDADGKRRNVNDLIARINDPNAEWIFGGVEDENTRSGASLMREEEEEMKRKGIPIPPRRTSPIHSSQASSSGYIPPPEDRTPGGTRIWKYRDYIAYVQPFCVYGARYEVILTVVCSGRLPIPNHYQRKLEPEEEFPFFTSNKPDADGVRWAQSNEIINGVNSSERVDLNSRDFRKDVYEQHTRGPERDVEIRIKLQISVDPPLLGNSESNSDGTRAFAAQLPVSTRKPSEADDRGMVQSTAQTNKTGGVSQVERGLRTETLVIIVLSIMVGFMAGFIVCR
ncbi:hypothetical protein FQN54_006241 [Arachnomyces sp. PD_36]|nr:hypothetical protein FQN54_006241 [Arachnomyces sp. PD_36]